MWNNFPVPSVNTIPVVGSLFGLGWHILNPGSHQSLECSNIPVWRQWACDAEVWVVGGQCSSCPRRCDWLHKSMSQRECLCEVELSHCWCQWCQLWHGLHRGHHLDTHHHTINTLHQYYQYTSNYGQVLYCWLYYCNNVMGHRFMFWCHQTDRFFKDHRLQKYQYRAFYFMSKRILRKHRT